MRVALLSTFGETCGIATYSEALAEALAGQGAETIVLSPRLRRGDGPRGPQPPRIWKRDRASLLDAARTFRELRRAQAQVAHIQVSMGLSSPRFLYALALLCRRAGLPLLATLHERGGGRALRRFEFKRTLLALRSADLIVHEQDQRAELARERVHVIPHGIWSIPEISREEARRELGIAPPGPLLAHFGFLHPDKGIEDVLEAVARLRAGAFPQLGYRVCGGTFPTGPSREYLARLRQRVEALGLKDAVHLTGEFLSERQVTLEMQAADLLLLNYRTGNNQGASGAGRRALAAGRPLAVSQAPIFDDMRQAVHTLEGPLEHEVAQLLGHPARLSEVAARGRSYCRTRSWSHVAEAHLALYRRLAPARSR